MLSIMFPDELELFREGPWPDDLFVCPQRAGRAAGISTLPELASIDALLAVYDAPISQRWPEGRSERVKGANAALAAYRAGATLYLRKVERFVPALDDILTEIADELGLLPSLMTTEIFASSARSGVAMHADYDINFQILFRGRKTWRVAPNEHVRNPTEMCLPDGNLFDPFQVEIADRTPFPSRMPDDARTCVMEAGSLIFVPCGWWHETAAEGECLALNVVCKGPRMADVLADGLRRHLFRDPAWRALAHGMFGANAARSGPRAEEFGAMLAHLGTVLDPERADGLARELLLEFTSFHARQC